MEKATPPYPHCSTVIWDVGGTLVDRVAGPEEVLTRALRTIGLSLEALDTQTLRRSQQHYIRAERLWRTMEEEAHGYGEIATILLEGTELADDPDRVVTLSEALGGWDWVYRPIPGMPELLEELGSHGIRQAVASNWPPSLSRFLGFHGLDRHFFTVIGSGSEGCRKPDASFYQRVRERLGSEVDTAVFVGNDPDLDILPGRAAGLMTIHFDPRRQHAGAEAYDVPTLRQHLLALVGLPER
jgi:FMN phosphatase YigB (HAD superfamily)